MSQSSVGRGSKGIFSPRRAEKHPLELLVRENTQLSGPLHTAELRCDVTIHRVLPKP
jgi:hypothetical protein